MGDAGELMQNWANSNATRPENASQAHRPATCASATLPSGSQNVISIARYISTAVESSTRVGATWPV
jgi:hypothetical protein